jgi:hypothetical protein
VPLPAAPTPRTWPQHTPPSRAVGHALRELAGPVVMRQMRRSPDERSQRRGRNARIVRAGSSIVKGTRRSFLKPLRRNDLQDPPLSAGDLCQPSGPDGEGQARGQARNARGEPQRLSEGRTGPSQLRVKPCGHAESFATLPSWLPQKLLIMNHFGLNYKRH